MSNYIIKETTEYNKKNALVIFMYILQLTGEIDV